MHKLQKYIGMKKAIIWILAFIITLLSAYYQRKTGPTYPLLVKFKYNEKVISYKSPRSNSTNSYAIVKIVIPDTLVYGYVYQRVYPLNTGYTALKMRRIGDTLIGKITPLPPAGKMEYYVELYNQKDTIYTGKNSPIIVRFKGDVPLKILIPHILAMFLTLFLGLVAGFLALANDLTYKKVQIWAFFFLIIGGFILGPIVQHYAFGQWWTGIPFGWDLTDNKTLVMFIVWSLAILNNIKHNRRWWAVIAASVMIIVYLIPHSLFGSTLDPNTGKIISGFILSGLLF